VPHFSLIYLPLCVLGAIAAVILFVVVPRRAATNRTVETSSDEEPTWRLVGGGSWFGPRSWPMRATWPFVRLDKFSWGIRVGPSMSWMAWAVPTTEMKWSEILVAPRTGRVVGFTLRSNPRRTVKFGPPLDERLISALRTNGVQVE
jgi:hypothetical protein